MSLATSSHPPLPGLSWRTLILCLRDKAYHEDGVPWVVPAKAGTQRRKLLCDVRPCDERRAWIPACAGMTRVSKRAVSLTTSESLPTNCRISSQFLPVESRQRRVGLLRTNGNGRLHSRRDCPSAMRVYSPLWGCGILLRQRLWASLTRLGCLRFTHNGKFCSLDDAAHSVTSRHQIQVT